jgi:hypothetical protein
MTSVCELIECAAQLLGSETKLAKACEVTQNAILQAKSRGRAQLLAGIIQRKAEDVAAKEAHLPRWERQ